MKVNVLGTIKYDYAVRFYDTPCSKLLVDSGCEITCISSSLISPDCLTGKQVLLQSFRSSGKGDLFPLAKVHLKVGSFSRDVEVAVCNDLTDDVLLGSDLGLDNLGNWLTQANTKLVCQTRAQADQEQAQETVVNSGAETHTLGELFNFEDDFLAPEPVHATPPDPNPSVLTLPNLTLDSSDKAMLIEQQANDFSLNTVRELANQQLRGVTHPF